MHDTVPNGINFIDAGDYPMFGVGESIQHHLDSDGMILNVGGHWHFGFACRLMIQYRTLDADTFHQSFGQYAFIRHIEQLVLERGAAAIYNEYFQFYSLPQSQNESDGNCPCWQDISR
jgi:hypothetical protein